MDKVKILVVDDHQLILNGISEMLRPFKQFKIIGMASNGKEAVKLADKLQPDVIFMDISMPEMNGIEATRIITQQHPEIKILALTQHDENEYVMQILKAGGSGYLLKNSKKDIFEEAIGTVLSGEKYLSKEISEQMISEIVNNPAGQGKTPEDIHLTKREIEIIRKIADDMSNLEIANELHISLRTVETHRRNLMQKLKVNSVVALLRHAAKRNLISFK
jgi:two-component system nitrate/nitrite response regulator NarL